MTDTLRDRLGAPVRERIVNVLSRHKVEYMPFSMTKKSRRWSCACGKWGEKDDIVDCLNAAREHIADELEAALAAQPAPAVMGEGVMQNEFNGCLVVLAGAENSGRIDVYQRFTAHEATRKFVEDAINEKLERCECLYCKVIRGELHVTRTAAAESWEEPSADPSNEPGESPT